VLTFHLLRAFVILARHGRYGPAAAELGVSQATLSAQIATLERILGLHLCEQLGGRTRLTSAAQELLEHARELVSLVDEATLAMAERAAADPSSMAPVHIAADTTVGTYVLPAVLGDLRIAHPHVRVELAIMNRAAVTQTLAANDADIVVLGQPPDLDDLEIEPYLRHDLVAIAAPDHPLVALPAVPFTRFATEPFVVREPGSGTRRVIEQICADAGLRPRFAMELGHNGAIKAAVAAGFGVGVISMVAIDREVCMGHLALVPVEGFPLPRRWHIIRRRSRRLSAAGATVIAFLRAQRDTLGGAVALARFKDEASHDSALARTAIGSGRMGDT
jgi:DNA-binding transcriptional LysR family regulator